MGTPLAFLRACVVPDGWALATPDRADLIIFAESHRDDAACGRFLTRVRAHPVFRRHRSRCVVHCGADRPIPLVPGFYPSIQRRWHHPRWTRSSCYLVEGNPFIAEAERDAAVTDPTVLASFVGACRGKPVRQRLLGLSSDVLDIRDTGEAFVAALRSGDTARVRDMKRLYVRSIVASRFVLCPRGTGASSIRLFETMRLGRVPVIIADDWVEPVGPDWSACAVRVGEQELDSLADRLRSLAGESEAMGRAARSAWEAHFAPSALLGRLVEQASSLIGQSTVGRIPGRVRGAASVARREIITLETRRIRSALRSGLDR